MQQFLYTLFKRLLLFRLYWHPGPQPKCKPAQKGSHYTKGLVFCSAVLLCMFAIDWNLVEIQAKVPDESAIVTIYLPVMAGTDGNGNVPATLVPTTVIATSVPSQGTSTPTPTSPGSSTMPDTPTPDATSLPTSQPTTQPTTQAPGPGPSGEHPILFVSQLPIRADFLTIGSTFGNHQATLRSVGRGGDLWIRYPDGEQKNLTAAAGYGSTEPSGFQGVDAIAVRDPDVHWDGQKAIFSMVVGAAAEQYEYNDYRWQLYEVTGLAQGDTPVITLISNQPTDFNNVSPIYGTDDKIIFTSDRPRNGAAHLYPQLDEYELAPTNTGLWRLDPGSGELALLNHAPSGNFTPLIDSYGRVLFTQWDHLQRDQQADGDNADVANGNEPTYGTFNYADESASAAILDSRAELFPEPRRDTVDKPDNVEGLRFNHFFPWEIREDGTESEVLNHLGRHELHDYFNRSFNTDDNLDEFIASNAQRANPNSVESIFHMAEDPLQPGLYYGVDAPEFQTHSSGRIVSLSAPPSQNPDLVTVTYVTHPDTVGNQATPNHSGHYREPLPLANGDLIAVHTAQTADEASSGNSVYDFRLKRLEQNGAGYWVAAEPLTSGISKTVSYWSPDNLITYSGLMWELNPVEEGVRARPTPAEHELEIPESDMLTAAGVDEAALRSYLTDNDLALVVSRDVTQRDVADLQQPFNLRVVDNDGFGVGKQTSAGSGTLYDVAYMQFFQADQIRGWYSGSDSPRAGRRVLAQPLHEAAALGANPASTGPAGSVIIAEDGSVAAFVPTQRALSWQLTDEEGEAIVRERYWLTFQPGEIRVCTSCHGANQVDQVGVGPSQNAPDALLELLNHWQESQ